MQISGAAIKRIVVVALVCCLIPFATHSETSNLAVVNAAGAQRMLSQRTLRLYAQLAANVQPDKASAGLKQSLVDLRSNIALLRQAAPGAADQIEQQDRLVTQLYVLVAQPPASASIGQAIKLTDDLLSVAESTTKAVGGSAAQVALLGLAARQRMLSQRAAAAYFVQQTGQKSPANQKRLVAALDEFKNVLAAFDDHKDDFPGIASSMDLARMQMVFFDNAAQRADSPTAEQMNSVSTASDRILSQMEELTQQVQKRLAEQQPSLPAKVVKK